MLIYLILVNAFAAVLMLADKVRAKKKLWRVPEAFLFIIALVGGSLGIWAGMYLCRHKTRHIKFVIGIPLILVLQIVIGMYFMKLG